MIYTNKELPQQLREQLKQSVYWIVGHLFTVYKELPCGFPEYIYQEALDMVLSENDIHHKKEFYFHPIFKGRTLKSYFKCDFLVESSMGNVIIECKAIEKIGEMERHQLFSYLTGTLFPIGILVNFSSYPFAEVEKYYFDKTDGTITAF